MCRCVLHVITFVICNLESNSYVKINDIYQKDFTYTIRFVIHKIAFSTLYILCKMNKNRYL